MFKFGSSEYLWLLFLVPVVLSLYWYGFFQRRKALGRFGNPDLLSRLTRSQSPRRQKFKACLLLVALLSLILGLARPQFGTRVETVKREGQDVFIALDVSASMLAEDIRPNRLEKAKRELSDLIDQLEGDRIGLIAFAGEAFVQCPLTLDYGAAKLFLSAMDPSLIPTPGTAIGEAIRVATASFSSAETKSKVLVIITDGEDHDGQIEERIGEAADAGIIIHTIGIGNARGVPIPFFNESGQREGFKKDRNGEVVLTKLDEGMLEQIAGGTDGTYLPVSEQGGELDLIYEQILGMEKSELATRNVTLFDEKFQITAGLALLFLVAELLIAESRRADREWKGRFL